MRKINSGVSIHIETPTLDKMLANKAESQAIGNFIEWLGERGYVIAQYGDERPHRDTLMPVHKNTETMLAEYFEIDLDKAEKERRKILAGIQVSNG